MEGSSVLCSNGIPYAIDPFSFAGQVPYDDYAKASGVEGDFSKGLGPAAARREQYPMDLDIINFEPAR